MKFYKTEIWFADGRHFIDYWVHGKDAECYFRPDVCKDVVRAEFWECGPDEENFKIEERSCLGEWDKEGRLCYRKEQWKTNDRGYHYDWDHIDED